MSKDYLKRNAFTHQQEEAMREVNKPYFGDANFQQITSFGDAMKKSSKEGEDIAEATGRRQRFVASGRRCQIRLGIKMESTLTMDIYIIQRRFQQTLYLMAMLGHKLVPNSSQIMPTNLGKLRIMQPPLHRIPQIAYPSNK